MAEGTYVKLTGDQTTLHDIVPGELNQPGKRDDRRCEQCGQILQDVFEYPADEDWTTGIFGCAEDKDSCMTGLFCPCVLFGRNAAALDDNCSQRAACVSHALLMEGNIAFALGSIAATFTGVMAPETLVYLSEGFFSFWWVSSMLATPCREILQRKYHLKRAPCESGVVHCCLHWCAICQEHRERMNHLCEGTTSRSTVIHPPRVQEMNAANKHDQPSSSSSSSPDQDGHNNLKLQPL